MLNRLGRKLRLLKRLNWVMLLSTALLLVVGVLFVYSSCYVSEEQPVRLLYKRQIVWVVAGMGCSLWLVLWDYRRWRRYAWWLYGLCMILLVLVLLIGARVYGARRWLMIFDVGIQPSEFAKLATIGLLARQLSLPGVNYRRPSTIAGLLALVLLPVALIVKEPDLGTAMVFVPTAAVMMFVAGVPLRVLGSLALAACTGVGLLLGALFLPARMGMDETAQVRMQQMTGISDYQKDRIEVFFRSDKDPLGVGWNKRQSEIAVGSGGPWGKGFLKGTQNVLGFLPRSVAPTDFIYSVIAEETGFFGSAVVLLLYALLLICGVWTGVNAPDKMGRLLCAGIVGMFFSHVFVNIAMTVGLMPVTGLPLPLLSYGGSFMIVMLSALGIVQGVHVRSRRRGAFL